MKTIANAAPCLLRLQQYSLVGNLFFFFEIIHIICFFYLQFTFLKIQLKKIPVYKFMVVTAKGCNCKNLSELKGE